MKKEACVTKWVKKENDKVVVKCFKNEKCKKAALEGFKEKFVSHNLTKCWWSKSSCVFGV
jgi:hypothetical protein